MTHYQVPREETSINLTNISEQVYWSLPILMGLGAGGQCPWRRRPWPRTPPGWRGVGAWTAWGAVLPSGPRGGGRSWTDPVDENNREIIYFSWAIIIGVRHGWLKGEGGGGEVPSGPQGGDTCTCRSWTDPVDENNREIIYFSWAFNIGVRHGWVGGGGNGAFRSPGRGQYPEQPRWWEQE